MKNTITGPFDVKLTLAAPDEINQDPSIGRMLVDKQYHGDMDATGKGQMLSATTSIKTSAGYIAIERVSGTLKGLAGSFVLQHSGIMNRGTPQLSVTVVPDSGTDQLTGLSGSMDIIIEGGKHSYKFTYTLPEAR
ncbi:MAG: DUF3224 domain-containing protein [Bacteroidota bacterium]